MGYDPYNEQSKETSLHSITYKQQQMQKQKPVTNIVYRVPLTPANNCNNKMTYNQQQQFDLSKINEEIESEHEQKDLLTEDILDTPFGGMELDIDFSKESNIKSIMEQLDRMQQGLTELTRSIQHEQSETDCMNTKIDRMQTDLSNITNGNETILVEEIDHTQTRNIRVPNKYIGRKRSFADALDYDNDFRVNKRRRICG